MNTKNSDSYGKRGTERTIQQTDGKRAIINPSSRSRRRLFVACCLVLAASCFLFQAPSFTDTTTAQTATDTAADSNLLETGQASQMPATPPPVPAEIKFVSYNIRWRGGDDLQKLIRFLREDAEIGKASIIGLQEVDRNKKRTNNVNTARVMADALKMHYAWAAPPPEKPTSEEETGVTILSPYPLTDVVRIVLPHAGPNGRHRAAIGATVQLGTERVRFYSVHAETRMPVAKKVDQWGAPLKDFAKYPDVKRAVVVGDFNTVKGKENRETRRIFTEAGFTTPIPHGRSTFQRYFFVRFKLDWVWLRGFETTGHGIYHGISVSDHWPLWVNVKMTPLNAEAGN
ncbi:MAG TPA: endonuclease/exonuclease/phosphatase family protein [Pyrinomonadaceae bacterium]|jgi:endonuclease/exonuclease/phosphatase family metal-dependent hydrolase